MASDDTAALSTVRSIALPDIAADARAAQTALRMSATVAIANQEEYELASDDVKAIKARWSKLDEQRKSITGPLAAVTKLVNDLFRPALTGLADAEAAYKAGMVRFVNEQERKRAEEQRQAELRAAEERERQAAEAQRLQDEADAAAAAGNAEQAAELQQHAAATEAAAAVVVAAPPLPAAKTRGVSAPKTVDFEVTSLADLVRWVVKQMDERDDEAALAYLQADETRLRNQVRATGLNTKIGGVRVFEKTSIRVR